MTVHLLRELVEGKSRVACGAPATFGEPRRWSGWSQDITCMDCLEREDWAPREGEEIKRSFKKPKGA